MILSPPLSARSFATRALGRVAACMACALVLLGFIVSAARAAQTDQVRVRIDEVDTLFANPGQGCMSQQRTSPEHPRFPYSVVYVRFNWADAEPEEGRYNWALIDDVMELFRWPVPELTWRATGCPHCSMTGYHGRVGIFEVWPMRDEEADLILQHADEHTLRRRLRKQGMPTLLEDDLAKVAEGITSLAELQTVGGFSLYAPGGSGRSAE